MDTTDLKPSSQDAAFDDALAHIEEQSGVSVVEILRIVSKHGISIEGDFGLESASHKNVFFWSGASKEAVSLLSRLIAHPSCAVKSTSVAVYALDGRMLTLPLVRSARSYVKPRWLPIVLNWKPSADSSPKL